MDGSFGSTRKNDSHQFSGDLRQRHRRREHYTSRRNERQTRIDNSHHSGNARHRSHRYRNRRASTTRRRHSDVREHSHSERRARQIRPSSVDEASRICGQLYEKCQGMLDQIQSARVANSSWSRRRDRTVNHTNLKAVPLEQSNASQASYTSRVQPTWETMKVIDKAMLSDGDTMLHKLEVSLLCPLTQSRLVTPVRGQSCHHLQCFDGEAYYRLMAGKHRSKWLCPCCRLAALPGQLIIDMFTQELLRQAPEDAKIIEFTSSTHWKVKQNINDNMQESQTKDAVVDLTGLPDTPVKVVNTKSNDSGYKSLDTSVIDLTMSP